jgi:hypothetical protein
LSSGTAKFFSPLAYQEGAGPINNTRNKSPVIERRVACQILGLSGTTDKLIADSAKHLRSATNRATRHCQRVSSKVRPLTEILKFHNYDSMETTCPFLLSKQRVEGQEITMKRAPQPTAGSLMAAGLTTVLLLPGNPCFAAKSAGELPWDQTLIALQNFLVDSMAPAIIVVAFVSAAMLYALGGHDKQAGRLFGSGLGGCIALAIVHLLNYVAL